MTRWLTLLAIAVLALASPRRAHAGCRNANPMLDTDGYLVVHAAAATGATTDDRGTLARFGDGALLGVTMLGGCRGMGIGFDASLLVLDGDGGRAVDLTAGLLISAPLEWPVVPFVELGGAAGRLRIGGDRAIAVGPLVEIGLQGVIGRHGYWRLAADAIGAGDDLFAVEAGAGWTWPM